MTANVDLEPDFLYTKIPNVLLLLLWLLTKQRTRINNEQEKTMNKKNNEQEKTMKTKKFTNESTVRHLAAIPQASGSPFCCASFL